MLQRGRMIATVGLAFACARSVPPSTGASPEVPGAVVTPEEARIVLPVGHAIWAWDVPETPTWHFEYRWEVRIDSSDYSFGFYRSKVPRATLGEGCLAELLRAGHAQVPRRADQR